jgi:hypothetical protein
MNENYPNIGQFNCRYYGDFKNQLGGRNHLIKSTKH